MSSAAANSVPARADVDRAFTWDTDSIFASPDDWENAFHAGEDAIGSVAGYQGRLAEGPGVLAEYFAASEDLLRRIGHVFVYASLNYAVDTNDQSAVARYDRARGLYARVSAALAFAEPEMLAIGPDTLMQWTEQEPRLAPYRHYFDQLAQRAPHVRSAEVEALLKQAAEPFTGAGSIHGILTNTDLTFSPATDEAGGEHPIAQGNINKLLTDPDRQVRRTAYESYADAHLAHKNTMAACLATGIKQNVFLARARNYASALHAALTPGHIPVEVFHNLIAAYQKNLPTWHRYWGLRRRALGLEKLAPYDVKAPLDGGSREIAYPQAVEWIAEGMAPLGDEYVSILRRGATEQRWVDVYPNQGKRMGAFSSGTPGTHPFIMMSYNDDLLGLSTLAHELGHSLHSYFTWQTQPLVYSRYGMFVAETASNFNQALVRAHLLEKFRDDRAMQVAIIEEAMSNFHRYFFVMPTLARFELEIHERVWRGEALTAQTLTDLMADLFAEGFGPEVEMDRDRVGSTWMQFSTHLYANFYVFQYATGISAAHALSERVRSGGEQAASDYLSFLKAGGSAYPLDVLKQAGVDMASPEPVESTFAVMAGYVDRLEKLLQSS